MAKLKVTIQHECTSPDLVRYFASRFELKYGRPYPIIYAKDCSVMKRIIQTFSTHNRGISLIPKFIDWVFAEYDKGNFPLPLTVGFLVTWVPRYIGVYVAEEAKAQKKKPAKPLSNKMVEWLEDQRKNYKRKVL